MKRKLQAVRPMARRAGSRERKAYFWEGGRGGEDNDGLEAAARP